MNVTNDLKQIPCMLMRGGTSKGAFFHAHDIPEDIEQRNKLLLRIMGSPDSRQIDGIGGGTFVTSKLALLSPSVRQGVDIDYKFIQVMVDEPIVDDSPTCGNILSGVGVFALENNLVPMQCGSTTVTVYDINTQATIRQVIQTPNKRIRYQGDFMIAGVPTVASPIELYFTNIAGGITGNYLPTGNAVDVVDVDGEIEMSCIDVSMPIVFVVANQLGISGYESKAELDANDAVKEKLLAIRELASHKMGMGSAQGSVIPKICIISLATAQLANINIRYFTPKDCHPAVAVSAGVCIATGCFIKDSLVNQVCNLAIGEGMQKIHIQNPAGVTPIQISFPEMNIESVQAKVVRTARILFSGNVFV